MLTVRTAGFWFLVALMMGPMMAALAESNNDEAQNGSGKHKKGAAQPNSSSATSCPPNALVPLSYFDLVAYVAAPWYVQRQVPLNYQPVNELYCVKAEYELIDPRNISAGIVVNNYANVGKVNGPSRGSSKYDRTNSSRLLGFPANPGVEARDGKLLVGPELLQQLLPGDAWRAAFGPYWIVAVGLSKNPTLKYDWAIISGGPPRYTSPRGNGCSSVPYTGNTTACSQSNASSSNSSSGSDTCIYPTTTSTATTTSAATTTANVTTKKDETNTTNVNGSGNVNGNNSTSPNPGRDVQGPATTVPQASPRAAPADRPMGGRGPADFDRGGLWFFSRKPVDPEGAQEMDRRAKGRCICCPGSETTRKTATQIYHLSSKNSKRQDLQSPLSALFG
ncbi:hypothetical protein VOLCADRAFT_88022 [Volvox carteri f. nagariensis]|uniref:Uncharacterized protein n=1 Tax=Volvox carteri f. nagariensis TaxID=3068 RepID=D8TMV4_VOLCA|nr:uncharacterized protein VOLCADRAFT_88022 [Volvox carteri f. nagariensis]EFJ51190.1 hypothetical protein VOLCADRAFT_88022 [Volvox carteri f. nagariensis]|eukprot:XP_002947657.1 hypothetical protein VOLCADRAFT_88022 [Volvox carteri f. nagariensis]